MYYAYKEKQKMTNDRRNRTTKSRNIQKDQRKGNVQIHGK